MWLAGVCRAAEVRVAGWPLAVVSALRSPLSWNKRPRPNFYKHIHLKVIINRRTVDDRRRGRSQALVQTTLLALLLTPCCETNRNYLHSRRVMASSCFLSLIMGDFWNGFLKSCFFFLCVINGVPKRENVQKAETVSAFILCLLKPCVISSIHLVNWDHFFFSLVPFWFTRVFCPFLCRMVQSTCNQVKNLYKCTLFTFASGKASCQSFLYIRFWRAVVCRVAPMAATCVCFFHPAEFTLVFRNNI